jgi:hypothetical protein
LRIRGVSFTEGTMRFLSQTREGFWLVRAEAPGLEGHRFGRRGRSRHRALGPGEVQNDEKPDECEQDELREKKMRLHGVTPSNMC